MYIIVDTSQTYKLMCNVILLLGKLKRNERKWGGCIDISHMTPNILSIARYDVYTYPMPMQELTKLLFGDGAFGDGWKVNNRHVRHRLGLTTFAQWLSGRQSHNILNRSEGNLNEFGGSLSDLMERSWSISQNWFTAWPDSKSPVWWSKKGVGLRGDPGWGSRYQWDQSGEARQDSSEMHEHWQLRPSSWRGAWGFGVGLCDCSRFIRIRCDQKWDGDAFWDSPANLCVEPVKYIV